MILVGDIYRSPHDSSYILEIVSEREFFYNPNNRYMTYTVKLTTPISPKKMFTGITRGAIKEVIEIHSLVKDYIDLEPKKEIKKLKLS